MKSSAVNLTEGPIARGLILFAIPLLVSNLFQQLYNSIDSAVVGSFAGPLSLAAVGSTAALINLLIGFFLGISTGTGILYAMYYGADDRTGLKKLTDAGIFLSLLAAAFITAVGVVFAPQLLRLMDMPDDVMPEAVVYLRIYLCGTVVNLLYNVAAGMIRARGDSARPLLYLFCSGLLNLLLDLLFVALLGWGAAGAALATVLAQALSAVLSLRYLMRLPEEYRFRPLHMRIDGTVMKDLIRVSLPCGLQGSMFNISNLLVQVKINAFGSVAMAGVTAYNKLDGFIYMPAMALSLTVSTYVGQNVGAGHYDRVRRGLRLGLIITPLVSLVISSGVMLVFPAAIRLFTTDTASIGFARQMMFYLAPFAWIFTFSDILGGAIRGAGAATPVTVITALCICVFRVIWLSVLMSLMHDIRIVFLCYPVSWILCTIVMTVYFLRFSALRRTLRATPAANT